MSFLGAVIIFTGIFSVVFLKQKLRYFHWAGIVTVMAGLIVVGMSDFLSDASSDVNMRNVIIGAFL